VSCDSVVRTKKWSKQVSIVCSAKNKNLFPRYLHHTPWLVSFPILEVFQSAAHGVRHGLLYKVALIACPANLSTVIHFFLYSLHICGCEKINSKLLSLKHPLFDQFCSIPSVAMKLAVVVSALCTLAAARPLVLSPVLPGL
jgi:hypothetical protein